MPPRLPAGVDVVIAYEQERVSRLLVRVADPLLNPALVTKPVDLEDLVLAYLETKTPRVPPVLTDRT